MLEFKGLESIMGAREKLKVPVCGRIDKNLQVKKEWSRMHRPAAAERVRGVLVPRPRSRVRSPIRIDRDVEAGSGTPVQWT